MGRPPLNLSRKMRAQLGCGLGILTVAVGVLLVAGLGPALIAAGALVGVYCLVVYDVDEPKPPEQPITPPRRVIR